MLLTLALLVLFSSIIVFFSEEFIKAFKRLFAIKGAKLFLPLFLASWLIYTYDFWFLWGVFYLHEMFGDILLFLVSIMPFQKGAESVARIILLTALSVVPVLILEILSRRKSYKGYRHPYLTSGIIWIFSVFLIIVI